MPNNNLFSLLPDDDPADAKAPRDRKKEKEDKARARQEALKKANNANGAKSKQAREAEDLRSLAFGAPKAKGKNKNKKGKAGGAASTQEGAGDAKKAGSEDPVGRDDKSSGSADDKAKAKQEEEFKKWQEDDAKRQADDFREAMRRATILSLQEMEKQKSELAKRDEERRAAAGQDRLGMGVGAAQAPSKKGTVILSFGSSGGPNPKPAAVDSAKFPQSKPIMSEEEIAKLAEQQAERAVQRERRLEELHNGAPPGEVPVLATGSGSKAASAAEGKPSKKSSRNGPSSSAYGSGEPAAFAAAAASRLSRELSLKEAESNMLRRENERLKAEALDLRRRLEQAETKEKADVLAENEELKKLREELTEELTQLQGDLERERTHAQELAKELRKTQDKRVSSSHSSSKPE